MKRPGGLYFWSTDSEFLRMGRSTCILTNFLCGSGVQRGLGTTALRASSSSAPSALSAVVQHPAWEGTGKAKEWLGHKGVGALALWSDPRLSGLLASSRVPLDMSFPAGESGGGDSACYDARGLEV